MSNLPAGRHAGWAVVAAFCVHACADSGTGGSTTDNFAQPEPLGPPDAVWPFQGDSILLVDLGNARLVRIGPDLAFGASRPIATFAGDEAPVMVLPDAVDGEGNAFVSVLGGYPPPDSGAILRIGLTTGTVDTIARYKLREYEVTETDDGTYVVPVRLSPQDAWGVAPDGSVVIARAGHYGVNWFAPNGAVTHGDTIPYAPDRGGLRPCARLHRHL